MSSSSILPTCANCRHHTVKLVPKMREDAESHIDGSYFVADDEDVKVYSCVITGAEVGSTPITCPDWSAPIAPIRAEQDTRMRDMLAAWEARQAARADRDQR